MLCMVNGFCPLKGPSHWILFQDPDDATAALVDDSVWSIASSRKSEVQKDVLTFNCLGVAQCLMTSLNFMD